MLTSGLTQFTGRKIDESGKLQPVFTKATIKSLILHLCIVDVFLGLIIMVFRIPLPSSIDKSIVFMSQCTIPVSMIVIGCILSECKVEEIFDKATFYFTFIRLLVFPLLIFFTLKLMKIDSLIIGVSTLLTGMPAGSTTPILADKYGCDAAFGSRIIFVSTVCSLLQYQYYVHYFKRLKGL